VLKSGDELHTAAPHNHSMTTKELTVLQSFAIKRGLLSRERRAIRCDRCGQPPDGDQHSMCQIYLGHSMSQQHVPPNGRVAFLLLDLSWTLSIQIVHSNCPFTISKNAVFPEVFTSARHFCMSSSSWISRNRHVNSCKALFFRCFRMLSKSPMDKVQLSAIRHYCSPDSYI